MKKYFLNKNSNPVTGVPTDSSLRNKSLFNPLIIGTNQPLDVFKGLVLRDLEHIKSNKKR